MLNVLLNVENVFVKAKENAVLYGFYANQVVDVDDEDAAIELAKRKILARLKEDERIIIDSEYQFKITVEEITRVDDISEESIGEQGFVWYKQDQINT
jgi:DNA-directed RNA polymerase specialized sigma subunit